MADRAKNRIVIDLNQPAPRTTPLRSGGKTRRRRWPKVLGILAALCVVIVVIAGVALFLWWRHYQTTPAYSLALIVDAAQRDDMAAFRKQLDDEQIAKNLVTSVRDKASARYGIALSDSLQTRIDSLLPALLPQLRERIHTEVAKEVKEFSSRAQSKPFVVVALTISSLVTISTEGDNARATSPLPDRPIEVALRRDGDRWKVVDFKDDVLVQRVVDGMMKDLPPIGGVDLKIPLLKSPKPRRRNR
ncbi:MAG TPA: hypothetical protein VLA93_09200 [Pyrinomonadaceae bacterium]|nr:hypothetical protein [Pyrinomonadaceae bacterium]